MSAYRQWFLLTNTACAVSDNSGQLIDVNSAFCTLTERHEQALRGQYFADLFSEQERALIAQIWPNRDSTTLTLNLQTAETKLVSVEFLWDGDSQHWLLAVTPRDVDHTAREMVAAFENAEEAILIADKDRRYVAVNRAACELFETPREVFLTLTTDHIVQRALILPDAKSVYSRWFQTGEIHGEMTLLRRDGEKRIIEYVSKANILPGRDVAFMRDVTTRKKMEIALANSEIIYRTMFEANPHPMWVYDIETLQFLEVNDAALYHYGYTRDEFLNMTILDIRPLDEQDRLKEHLSKDLPDQTVQKQWTHRKKDGSLIRVEISSHVLSFNNRNARVVLAMDVTHRNQLEMERLRFVKQLQQLANTSVRFNLAEPLDNILRIVTDEARLLIGAHQAVTSLTINHDWQQSITAVSMSEKYAQYETFTAEPDGSGIYRLVCETNRPMRLTQDELEQHPAWRNFGKYLPEHPPMRGWLAVPLIGRDGSNIGLIQLSDRYDGEFTIEDENMLMQLAHLASVVIDNARLYEQAQLANEILEQRVADRTQALKQANERLQELDKLKTRFISDVSHELRNPIAQLSLKVELLKRGGAPSLERHLPGLEEQTMHLLSLTSQVLDISRLELARDRVVFRLIDFNALVTQVVDSYRTESLAERLEIFLETEPEIPPVWGERGQLIQMLTNLISNAIKYTPRGFVRVRTYFDAKAEQVCVTFEDSGIGMDEDDMAHIFDRFHRGKEAVLLDIPGTGLGLPIVREIAVLHGGRVEVESKVGLGSIFRVFLQASQYEQGK